MLERGTGQLLKMTIWVTGDNQVDLDQTRKIHSPSR